MEMVAHDGDDQDHYQPDHDNLLDLPHRPADTDDQKVGVLPKVFHIDDHQEQPQILEGP